MRRLISVFLIILLLTSSLFACSNAPQTQVSEYRQNIDAPLLCHFIDVGQGDCILLESDNTFVLIDAGETEYGQTVCDYLKSCNVKTIDYVIATHPHSDHCGGLAKVINTFECKNFITKETDHSTQTWFDVLQSVDKNDVNYIDAEVSDTYSFGQSSFEILGPCSNDYEAINNYSVVIKATCGDTSFLLTGDAETLSEKEMINNNTDLSADVLKIGHHGSTTSSSKEFLSAVSPTYAVISCGKGNEYGHPHKETINLLDSLSIQTFRTDELSTIVAASDKENITFYSNNTQIKSNSNSKNDYEDKPQNTIYIGNKNSKKFHLESCSSVADMKEENKVEFNSRQEAIDKSYSACKSCNP